jgi:AcrR family transcriptional regulator
MTSVSEKDSPVTEQRILDAAIDLFFERGYHATTMRDIAAAVGIKAGSMYNHYAGKQEILLRICLDTSRALYEGALAALDGVDDVEDRLRAFVVYHVTFHTEIRKPCRVTDTQLHYLESENRATVVEVRDAHEKLLRDILALGIKQRRWRSEDIHVMAIAITTMCTEVDAWFRPDGPLKPNQIATLYADFVRRGLGTP